MSFSKATLGSHLSQTITLSDLNWKLQFFGYKASLGCLCYSAKSTFFLGHKDICRPFFLGHKYNCRPFIFFKTNFQTFSNILTALCRFLFQNLESLCPRISRGCFQYPPSGPYFQLVYEFHFYQNFVDTSLQVEMISKI